MKERTLEQKAFALAIKIVTTRWAITQTSLEIKAGKPVGWLSSRANVANPVYSVLREMAEVLGQTPAEFVQSIENCRAFFTSNENNIVSPLDLAIKSD